jgi:hypothetical protein
MSQEVRTKEDFRAVAQACGADPQNIYAEGVSLIGGWTPFLGIARLHAVSCLFHVLLEDIYDRWVQLCTIAVNQFQVDPQIFQMILWSDEVILKLSHYVNKHICGIRWFYAWQWKHNKINLEYAFKGVSFGTESS